MSNLLQCPLPRIVRTTWADRPPSKSSDVRTFCSVVRTSEPSSGLSAPYGWTVRRSVRDERDTWHAEVAGYIIFSFLIRNKNLKLVYLSHTNFKFIDSFFYFFKKYELSFNIICLYVHHYFMSHISMVSFLRTKKRTRKYIFALHL